MKHQNHNKIYKNLVNKYITRFNNQTFKSKKINK